MKPEQSPDSVFSISKLMMEFCYCNDLNLGALLRFNFYLLSCVHAQMNQQPPKQEVFAHTNSLAVMKKVINSEPNT